MLYCTSVKCSIVMSFNSSVKIFSSSWLQGGCWVLMSGRHMIKGRSWERMEEWLTVWGVGCISASWPWVGVWVARDGAGFWGGTFKVQVCTCFLLAVHYQIPSSSWLASTVTLLLLENGNCFLVLWFLTENWFPHPWYSFGGCLVSYEVTNL